MWIVESRNKKCGVQNFEFDMYSDSLTTMSDEIKIVKMHAHFVQL